MELIIDGVVSVWSGRAPRPFQAPLVPHAFSQLEPDAVLEYEKAHSRPVAGVGACRPVAALSDKVDPLPARAPIRQTKRGSGNMCRQL